MSRDFDWPEFLFLLGAMRWTIVLSLIAFVGGGVGGLVLAHRAHVVASRSLRWLAGYVHRPDPGNAGADAALPRVSTALRCSPAFASTRGRRSSLAFTMYAAAFLGEIWRGAIQAIPRQQWEAAAALPLAPAAQLRHVILPQAFRIAIPPTVGFLVQLIKGTSIASIIGFVELTRAGQLIVNVTFQPMIVYPIVAVLYFALCWPISLAALRLERRIDAALGIKQHP